MYTIYTTGFFLSFSFTLINSTNRECFIILELINYAQNVAFIQVHQCARMSQNLLIL